MSESTQPLNGQSELESAQARETIYRLAAVTLGYPLEETLVALQEGRLQAAFSEAWQTLSGESWPALPVSASLQDLEVNVQAFYSHFGLKAAVDDEGHQDEPDHLVAMLEFCALLCYLERQALEQGKDAAPYRRAQRDFLMRYLLPLLHAMCAAYAKERHLGLDANLEYLLKALPDWAAQQQLALEAQVGVYTKETSLIASSNSAGQSMWD